MKIQNIRTGSASQIVSPFTFINTSFYGGVRSELFNSVLTQTLRAENRLITKSKLYGICLKEHLVNKERYSFNYREYIDG